MLPLLCMQAQSSELTQVSASLEASRTDLSHQKGKVAGELAKARSQASEAQQLGRSMEEAKKVRDTHPGLYAGPSFYPKHQSMK